MNVYEILLGAGAMAGALSAIGYLIYKIIKYLKRKKKKVVETLAATIINHEALAPIKVASEGMSDLMAVVQEVSTGVSEMNNQLGVIEENFSKEIKKIKCDQRDVALITLYNSLTRIYYDMRAKDKFSSSMYKSFTDTHALYKKWGGNGAVDGYDEDLKTWRKAEITAGCSV